MSAELAHPAARPSRPARLLRALPDRAERLGRVPFAIVVVALLAVGLAVALVLNTTIQQKSAELGKHRQRITELEHQEAVLSGQVQELRSPAHLQKAASELDMVPNPYPAFVDLRTGKVVGHARAVRGDEVPGIVGAEAKPKLEVGAGAATRSDTREGVDRGDGAPRSALPGGRATASEGR